MRSLLLLVPLGFAVTVLPAGAQAPPQIPSTFFGAVNPRGPAPPAQSDIRAYINEVDCTQTSGAGRYLIERGQGEYLVHVIHESQRKGCGAEGRRVTFRINGIEAAPAGVWKAGPQLHDLTVDAAAAEANAPAASATEPAVTVSTAAPKELQAASSISRAEQEEGGGGGVPWAVVSIGAGLGVLLLAGGGWLWTRRKEPEKAG
jgi:hypothetical protein